MSAKAPLLSAGREAVIQLLAETLVVKYSPEDRIDPEVIATEHGLPFRYAPFPEEFDGILLCEKGKFLVVCNERRSRRGSPRSRFTFAHELGHFFMPEHHAALQSGAMPPHFSLAEFASSEPIEREADCFAANLLMPEGPFRQHFLKSGTADLALVRDMADHFGTSVTSTAYRALGFDLFSGPAALFCWDQLGKLISRRMSPTTAAKHWQYCGLVDTPATDTLTANAIAHLRYGYHRRETHVMDWFSKLHGYEPEHQQALQEELISLGNHGWMTLVHA